MAFVNSVGKVWDDLGTHILEGMNKQCRPRQAIDVEITEDADHLVCRQCLLKPCNGFAHVRKQHGVVCQADVSGQVGVKLIPSPDAPVVDKMGLERG